MSNPASSDDDYESEIESDDDFESKATHDISVVPSFPSYDAESSVAKLPGSSLLRSVHQTEKNNHKKSNHSLRSDHTYDFGSDAEEFGGEIDSTHNRENGKTTPDKEGSTSQRLPAWKLRQQMKQNEAPPQLTISSSFDSKGKLKNSQAKASGARLGKPRSHSGGRPDANENKDASWFQKLTTKKETEEEREKREKNEKLISKQTPSRWGKDILEEDSSHHDTSREEDDEISHSNRMLDEDDEISESGRMDRKKGDHSEEEDESDTVKKVKSLIEKSFGSALIAQTTRKKRDDLQSSNSGDTTDEDEAQPPRINRWAMMGSAAMTSVRNMQKGWMEDNKEKEEEDELKKGVTTITEEEGSGSQLDEAEDGVESLKDEPENKRMDFWKNRGAAAFTSVRNAWGGAGLDSKPSDDDEDASFADDEESISSDTDHDHSFQPLKAIGNFWNSQKMRFDPEVWNDPQVRESLVQLEKLKHQLYDCRHHHKTVTRKRERQIESSIRQQKHFLTRKLHKAAWNYKKDPFHSCYKEVYQKEILIIVHEATSLGDDSAAMEKDDIDDLLDAKLSYHVKLDGEGSEFQQEPPKPSTKSGSKASNSKSNNEDESSTSNAAEKPVNRESLVPLETKLLRAQHNEWMTDHQMELERNFQQKLIEHMYGVLPEQKKEHAITKRVLEQEALQTKINELKAHNEQLKAAYENHVQAQERLLEIYRERYTPSVSDVDADEEREEDPVGFHSDAEDGNFESPPMSPAKRGGMWAKSLGQSVRGLFGPKGTDNAPNKEEEQDGGITTDDDDEMLVTSSLGSGFSLSSPVTGGSLSKNKFILSFGSPDGSGTASGILANFAPPDMKPPLATASVDGNKEETKSKKSENQNSESQESAQQQAAAAWKLPKTMDKAALPETFAEKRAKRAAARLASRPDVVAAAAGTKLPASVRERAAAMNGGSSNATTPNSASGPSRSELLQRARKARQESAAALGASSGHSPRKQPLSSIAEARSSLRSNTRPGRPGSTGAAARKELSMKDLMEKAGDSRKKLRENDSRMERLATKSKQHQLTSPLANGGRKLNVRELIQKREGDALRNSSHHSLHERQPNKGNRKPWKLETDNNPADDDDDADEFGS